MSLSVSRICCGSVADLLQHCENTVKTLWEHCGNVAITFSSAWSCLVE